MSLNKKSREQYEKFLKNNMYKFTEPGVYLGDEPNAFRYTEQDWDTARLRVLWLSSWPAAQIPGNQTIPLLYKLTGDSGMGFLSERCYVWNGKSDMKQFVKKNMPLFSLETRHPIYEFDLIATSLGYPPYLANFVQALKQAGIPPKREDRRKMMDEEGIILPIIISGGSLYGSPEPWTPVVDFVFVGEAEDEVDHPGLMAVFDEICKWRSNNSDKSADGRAELIYHLQKTFYFLYCPELYEPEYNDKKEIARWTKKFEDISDRPKVRLVKNLDDVPALTEPVIPYTDTSMGLGEIECMRGCPAFCTFCAVTFRRKPPVYRSPEKLVEIFKKTIRNSGAMEAFPTAYDFSSYPFRNKLIKKLLSEVISIVDTQSNRIDNISSSEAGEYLDAMCLSGMDQLVVALEGNSQRLRNYTNKHATEEDFLRTCDNAFRLGFRRLKVYMIANLYPETQEDTEEIFRLMEKVVNLKAKWGAKTSIRFSYTPLLVESNTPMQWDAATLDRRSLAGFNERTKSMGIEFSLGKKTERNYYVHTQLFHLADRLAADAIIDSYIELGATYFGGVDRKFEETVDRILKSRGIEKGVYHYFGAKSYDYKFGADIIDLGFKPKFMEDYHKDCLAVFRGEQKTNERGFIRDKCSIKCHHCGCCTDKTVIKNIKGWRKAEDDDFSMADIKIIDDTTVRQKVFAKFWIPETHRWIEYDHWLAQIRRACYQNDMPVAIKSFKAFRSLVKFQGWTAGAEYVEFGFTKSKFYRKDQRVDFVNKINEHLFHIKMLDIKEIPISSQAIKKVGDMFWYKVEVDQPISAIERVVADWKSGAEFIVTIKEDVRRKGIVSEKENMRDYVNDVWFTVEGHRVMANLLVTGKPNPYIIIAGLFGLKGSDVFRNCAIVQDILIYPMADSLVSFSCGVCNINDLPADLLGNDLEACPRCYGGFDKVGE